MSDCDSVFGHICYCHDGDTKGHIKGHDLWLEGESCYQRMLKTSVLGCFLDILHAWGDKSTIAIKNVLIK